jgi:anaerobic selenocysteine-containing dehydrogenase
LGLIHVIIADRLYDAEFVERWTAGFGLLAEQVEEYTPDQVETITGVPADLIRRVARTYATTKPAHLEAGNALEHHNNSAQALRAVMILRAITGNLDVPGGNVLLQELPLADISLQDKRPAHLKPLGAERYPLFIDLANFVPGDCLIDAVLDRKPYPIKAMIIAGGNPAVTWPNSQRVEQALDQLDFLVALDIYMTATARHADLVLPAASVMERTQLIVRAGPYGTKNPPWYLMLRKPVMDPAERRSDWWFWSELGRRMGYGDYYPWADEEQAINHLLGPTGITLEDLKASPNGLFYGQAKYRKYEEKGFRTPSGKVELYSTIMANAGYDPLPVYQEPTESPVSAPELAKMYPLVLTTGRREAAYTASRHRNLPSLRRAKPEPRAEIHPATAALYGIRDADWIQVETLRGHIQIKVKVTEDVLPDLVTVPFGWEEANANILTDDRNCDPVLSCPPLRSELCSVKRIREVRSNEHDVTATTTPTG